MSLRTAFSATSAEAHWANAQYFVYKVACIYLPRRANAGEKHFHVKLGRAGELSLSLTHVQGGRKKKNQEPIFESGGRKKNPKILGGFFSAT